jgi:FMN phosphatase YigB (HAD superfamily)
VLNILAIEAVIFDLDGTLAHFNLEYKALRGEVREYLIHNGIPSSILDVNESVFDMLKKPKFSLKTAIKLIKCLKHFAINHYQLLKNLS